jgi:oligogalacturonide lyase
MNPLRITQNRDANEQLLYFTSSSLAADDSILWFISDRTGDPNIFRRNLITGEERQLSRNRAGFLKSYVYFNGNPGRGLGLASISTDCRRNRVFFLQDCDLCVAEPDGALTILNQIPPDQVTAFTHVSADGKLICVPTTDARALETDTFVNDSPSYRLGGAAKQNEVITGKPDYDIDERVRSENLNSYLRIFDTATGAAVLCEKVPRAWITHVQFSPVDSRVILYNHEWAADCSIRRLWLWNGKEHIRLRTESGARCKTDWVCHEMWQADGQFIIYHGKFADGNAFVGRVSPAGGDNIEIRLPVEYERYGHFTAGNLHNNRLVSDGYFHPSGAPANSNWGGEWISLQVVDWENQNMQWFPLCEHKSFWDCQDSHPHPIFDHRDGNVYFTSNRDGKRAVFRINVFT